MTKQNYNPLSMLVFIQLLHTLITSWNYACLFYLIYCHLKDRCDTFYWIAMISIALEAIAIVPLGFVCPLRLYVSHHYSPQTPDIFFPDSCAQWIMPTGIALFVIVLLTKGWSLWRRTP